MPLCRVFRNPDNSTRVMRPNPRLRNEGEPEADFVARVCGADQQKDPTLAGLPFADVNDTTLPSRNRRFAWRLQNGSVVDDPTAPLPPHPRQAVLDKIDAATTILQLKDAMRRFVLGE